MQLATLLNQKVNCNCFLNFHYKEVCIWKQSLKINSNRDSSCKNIATLETSNTGNTTKQYFDAGIP